MLLGPLLAAAVLLSAVTAEARAMDERKAVMSAVSAMNALIFPALAAAGTYGELWQAMQFANTQNFRDDIGTIRVVPPGGTAFGLDDEAAFLAMVSQPLDRIGLAWRHGSNQKIWEQLDDALSQELRDRVQRIRDAQAGDPEAQQAILSARKAFALTHGSVFGHSPREYLTAQEWADYEAAQAAGEYRLQHPELGPPSNSP